MPSSRVAWLTGRRAIAIFVAIGVAIVLILLGVSWFGRGPDVIVTLSAAPGGHIEPQGSVTTAVGSELTIAAWDDDPTMSPVLLINGKGVVATSTDGARFTYKVSVTEAALAQASFIQLADAVRLVPVGAGGDILSATATRDVVLVRGHPAWLSGIAPGDILATDETSDSPVPLLVHVLSIKAAGDHTIIESSPAALTEAVLKASIRATFPLRVGQPTTTSDSRGLVGPAAVRAAGATLDVYRDSLTFDHTFKAANANGTAKLDLTSRADLTLGLDISLDIGLVPAQVNLFAAAVREDVAFQASLSGAVNTSLDDSYVAFQKDFAPGFSIGIVNVTPEVELGVKVTASASGNVTIDGTLTEGLRAGLSYERGQWAPIQEATIKGRGSASIGALAQYRVSPTLKVVATIEGVCGPYIEAQPGFLELNADPSANPWWTLDTGVGLSVGAQCHDIGPIHVMDPWELASTEFGRTTIAEANGALIGASTPTPPPATPTPQPKPDLTGLTVVSSFKLSKGYPDQQIAYAHGAIITNTRRDLAALIWMSVVAPDGSRIPVVNLVDGGPAFLLPSGAAKHDSMGIYAPASYDGTVATLTVDRVVWMKPKAPYSVSGNEGPLHYVSFADDCQQTNAQASCNWHNTSTAALTVVPTIILEKVISRDASGGGQAYIYDLLVGSASKAVVVPANGSARVTYSLAGEPLAWIAQGKDFIWLPQVDFGPNQPAFVVP